MHCVVALLSLTDLCLKPYLHTVVLLDCLKAQDVFISFVMSCCRYEFVTGNGLHAVMAAAASKGQVYVAGGTASSSQWQAAGPALRQAVQSFKLN